MAAHRWCLVVTAALSSTGCGARTAPEERWVAELHPDADAVAPADGDTVDATLDPRLIRGVQLVVGGSSACVLRQQGDVFCWGMSWPGTPVPSPRRVPGAEGIIEIDTSYFGASTCGTTARGEVFCWGRQSAPFGAQREPPSESAVRIEGLAPARYVRTGLVNFALHADGRVSCWGYERAAACGPDAGAVPYRVFVPVPAGVVELDAGAFACARTDRGEVWCWGDNRDGITGTGASAAELRVPLRVPLPFAADRIVVRDELGCAFAAGRVPHCWGWNYTWPGTDRELRSPQRVPVAVPQFSALREASSGYPWCFVDESGTARCWGFNGSDCVIASPSDTPPDRYIRTPTAIRELGTVRSVAVGAHAACALRRDDSVWCWGENAHGELGNGVLDVLGPEGYPCHFPPAPVRY